MNKLYLIILGFLFTLSSYSQDDNWMVDQVSTEICNQLENYTNLDQITKKEIDEIFYGTIKKHRDNWNQSLDNFPNSEDQNARDSYYYQIIDHRLYFNCSKYRKTAHLIDKTHANNLLKRKQHLSVREFVTMAELDKENLVLLPYFDQNLHGSQLMTDLQNIKRELNTYKYSSILNIVSSGNEFFVNLHDFKNGNSYLQLTLTFDNKTDQLITSWSYKLKEELDADQVDLEEFEFEDDFSDIMSIPPTAPPVDNRDSLKRKGNKR